MKIREALNEKMTQGNLTQSQLAGMLGIKQCLLSQIISGNRRASLAVRMKIHALYPELAHMLLTEEF